MEEKLFGICCLSITEVTTRDDCKNSSHHEYNISIETTFASWSVWRRFREFYQLNQALCDEFPDIIPKELFPYKKRIIRYFNMDDQFVESRRVKLEWYLRQLLFLPSLCSSEAIDNAAAKRIQQFYHNWKATAVPRKIQNLAHAYKNSGLETIASWRERRESIQAFIQSQELIFAQCNVLHEEVIEKIEGEKILDEIIFDSLFGPICKVSSILQMIMGMLEEISRDGKLVEPKIGALFIELKPHLNIYKEQQCTIPQMKAIFQQICERNQNFKNFVNSETLQQCLGGISVLDALTAILNHVYEYEKYFQRILDNTEEQHVDYHNLRVLLDDSAP